MMNRRSKVLYNSASCAPELTVAQADRPVILHVFTVSVSLRFLEGQVQYMQDRGFDVHVASAEGPEQDWLRSHAPGVQTHTVPLTRRYSPFADIWSILILLTIIRQLKPAIVHAHTPKGGLIGVLAARIARVPIRFYHMRGLPMFTRQGPARLVLWLSEWLTCRLATRVFAVSESLRRAALAERIGSARSICVLGNGSGNGVDIQRFDPDRVRPQRRRVREGLGIPIDAVTVGFVGRLAVDKGIRELTEAWSRVAESHPNAWLLIVGPTEARETETRCLLEQLSETPRVVLTGPSDEIPALMASMDVLCLPTYREGLPNVVLEAAAMGVPAVATSVTGCIDAVQDGVTGLLVPARDTIALTAALRRYIDNGEERHEHGAAARARTLKQYRPRIIWQELECAYREALTSSRMSAEVDIQAL